MRDYFDGDVKQVLEQMPCGGVPELDSESCFYGYRCNICGAVIGSLAQSKECQELNKGYKG